MIRRRYYFISMFLLSIILALLISLNSKDFLFIFLFYTLLFFIIIISITVFPYVYYNHLSEIRILNKIPKYSPQGIINILDARAKFYVSIHDEGFETIAGLIQEQYIEAIAVFYGHYMEFYQYASPYVLSYLPFLKIDVAVVVAIAQGKKVYPINTPDLHLLIKCNYFDIITNIKSYRLIVEQESTDRFISALLYWKSHNQNL